MKILACLLVSSFFAVASPGAVAADFPTKPLRIIVPFGGGPTDLITRLLAGEMSKELGQAVVVVNKPGGSAIIGATEIANAKNDGYTLGMLPVGPLTTQPNLHRLQYGPESFDYVCLVYRNPQVLLVRNDSPFKTVADLVAHAKKYPGQLNYGSIGLGTLPHLAVVALAKATGIDLFHVPYKVEADELTGLLKGDISLFVSHPTSLASHPNELRALAILETSRLDEYPNLPTLAEQGGPAMSLDLWGGLVVPKGTSGSMIATLENACRVATVSEAFRKRMESIHTRVKYMDGKSFSGLVAAEFERNGRLLRESGIRKD